VFNIGKIGDESIRIFAQLTFLGVAFLVLSTLWSNRPFRQTGNVEQGGDGSAPLLYGQARI